MKEFALMIVDMQRYYLELDSAYARYFNYLYPGSLSYIIKRSYNTVIPNIKRIKAFFTANKLPVIYLRLCGKDQERRDLHRFFKKSFDDGVIKGFNDVYPLESDPFADIIDDLRPGNNDIIINKTTFSPFASTNINNILHSMNINTIVFTGLATSQCVETTARDASDKGYEVYHIHDAQADYDEMIHDASLYCSRGVCGGFIYDTDSFIELMKEFI